MRNIEVGKVSFYILFFTRSEAEEGLVDFSLRFNIRKKKYFFFRLRYDCEFC